MINGCVAAPLDLDDFIRALNANNIPFANTTRNADWPTYGIKVSIQNQSYWGSFSFHEKKFDSAWLSWDGGITSRKGYNTTEKELIADKNALSKFMANIIGKEPEVREYNHDMFMFDWGYVSTSASLQSVAVTVGISWNKAA